MVMGVCSSDCAAPGEAKEHGVKEKHIRSPGGTYRSQEYEAMLKRLESQYGDDDSHFFEAASYLIEHEKNSRGHIKMISNGEINLCSPDQEEENLSGPGPGKKPFRLV